MDLMGKRNTKGENDDNRGNFVKTNLTEKFGNSTQSPFVVILLFFFFAFVSEKFTVKTELCSGKNVVRASVLISPSFSFTLRTNKAKVIN